MFSKNVFTRRRRQELPRSEWCRMNENVAHRYILNCMSVKEMRNVGKYIIKRQAIGRIYIYIYIYIYILGYGGTDRGHF